jgi:hypothetical protein
VGKSAALDATRAQVDQALTDQNNFNLRKSLHVLSGDQETKKVGTFF